MALDRVLHGNQPLRTVAEVEAERAKRRVEFTRIEFHDDGPDHLGRRRYTLFWMADYHPGHPDGEHGRRERGQCFHADPARALAKLAAALG